MFFGLSLTLTRENFAELTDPKILRHYHKLGSRLFFFVEYVPVSMEDKDCCLSDEQKKLLPEILQNLKEELPALYLSLPGEEEKYGGCLAAGRGFIHVSPTGNLEPCPFAPYSDSNIINMPLTEALDSLLMSRIRSNHHLLKESAGGCTLWENREWVMEQMEKSQSLSA
jgi:MoaA/NifB/PqqE/SkfB family radical SAM enzyme